MWPEIEKSIAAELAKVNSSETKVVILDAAVLLVANWHKTLCHEVWTCMIPREEAVARIQERDGKTKEEAEKIIQSQMSNEDIVAHSNVVFSTLWDAHFTQKQVEKAWKMLMRDLGLLE